MRSESYGSARPLGACPAASSVLQPLAKSLPTHHYPAAGFDETRLFYRPGRVSTRGDSTRDDERREELLGEFLTS